MQETRGKLGYTRETQKLMYWFFPCFAKYWGESEDYAKNTLQALFLEEYNFGYTEKALKSILSTLKNKDKLSVDTLIESVLKDIQSLLINKKTFSTSLHMLTQKQANDFIEFMFNKALEYGVELRQEIVDLFAKQEHDRFIYQTLLNKKCCICGRNGELQHFDRVGTYGYKSDTGMNYRVMCLCREHHTEADNFLTREEFVKKYGYKGIFLKPKQVEKLKKVYPNHFKAFEK